MPEEGVELHEYPLLRPKPKEGLLAEVEEVQAGASARSGLGGAPLYAQGPAGPPPLPLPLFIFFTFEKIPHGPAQAQGQYAQWARKHLHRESLREVSRCRHAALDRLLLRPTETFAGDPDHCRMMDDSPNDPGVANAWDSSDARGAHEDRPPRGV